MATTKSDSVFDVAKPGKNTPDATSRPIIVNRGKRLTHDPMVSDSIAPAEPVTAEEKQPEAAPSESKPTGGNKVIAPLTDTTEADKPSDKADKSEVKSKEPEDKKTDNSQDNPDEASDSAAVDAVADQAASKKKDAETKAVDEAEKVKQEHIDKLVDEKTYFLPIGQATRKKNARKSLAILVVLLLAAGAGAYIAYTLGLLKSLNIGS